MKKDGTIYSNASSQAQHFNIFLCYCHPNVSKEKGFHLYLPHSQPTRAHHHFNTSKWCSMALRGPAHIKLYILWGPLYTVYLSNHLPTLHQNPFCKTQCQNTWVMDSSCPPYILWAPRSPTQIPHVLYCMLQAIIHAKSTCYPTSFCLQSLPTCSLASAREDYLQERFSPSSSQLPLFSYGF